LIPYKDGAAREGQLLKRSSKDDYDTDVALKGRNFVPNRY